MSARPTKQRRGLFAVGKSKPSPARAASTKRASIRRSMVRSPDAPQLRLALQNDSDESFGDAVWPRSTPDEHDERASISDSDPVPAKYPSIAMADTPAPPSQPQTASTRPIAARPSQPEPSAKQVTISPAMPPAPRQAAPRRPPQHSATMPPPPRQQPENANANIFRRLTSKLRPGASGRAPKPANAVPERPQGVPQRKHTILRMPKAPAPAAAVNNDFTNAEMRQAALRASGLLPPAAPARFRNADGFMMSLSEQEAEIDRRVTVVVPRTSSSDEGGEESEARKIREAWLAKQDDASGPAFRAGGDDNDATLRASHDSERAHVRDVARAMSSEGSAEDDFHTAPNTPMPSAATTTRRSAEGAATSHPGATSSGAHAHDEGTVSEKVSRWLRTSTDAPQGVSADPAPSPSPPGLAQSRPSRDDGGAAPQAPSPTGSATAATARARKEKPPPIIVTAQRPSRELPAVPDVMAVAAATTTTTATGGNDSSDGGRSSPEASRGRGRAHGQLAHDYTFGGASAGVGARARSTTLPALSPTRTVSSSGAESALPTPTTTSCARDHSISRASTTHSSDNGHEGGVGVGAAGRPRRGTGGDMKAKAPTSGAAAVIMEEYSETEPSEEGGEFGGPMAPAAAPAAATPRPPRVVTVEEAVAKETGRKSFSLFGKKSLDLPRDTRTASSMTNLRRAFTSSKSRPKSSMDAAVAAEGRQQRGAHKMFNAAHLPPSPTFPVNPQFQPGHAPHTSSSSSVPSSGRTTGVGLRPRMPVQPTMHSRGTILLGTHLIEDEESRRLSEMAFLM